MKTEILCMTLLFSALSVAAAESIPWDETIEKNLRDVRISPARLSETLGAIKKFPATEQPSVWFEIINGSTFSDYHRRQGYFMFFIRHVKTPTLLSELMKIKGFRKMILNSKFQDIPEGGTGVTLSLDFIQNGKGSIVQLLPHLPSENNSTVYLGISEPLSALELTEKIRKNDIGEVKVLEWVISEDVSDITVQAVTGDSLSKSDKSK